MLDGLAEQTGRASAEMINEKIASMSCKAAVKGNHKMSFKEAQALIDELMSLKKIHIIVPMEDLRLYQ